LEAAPLVTSPAMVSVSQSSNGCRQLALHVWSDRHGDAHCCVSPMTLREEEQVDDALKEVTG